MTQKVAQHGTETTRPVSANAVGPGFDPVKKAEHYNKYGIECKEFSRHMHGAQAQAFQYIWRCDLKDNRTQDLQKAVFWLDDWVTNPTNGIASTVVGPNITQLRAVAAHFPYNLGRALECIYFNEPDLALELVADELRRYESNQQSAVAVSTTTRGGRGK